MRTYYELCDYSEWTQIKYHAKLYVACVLYRQYFTRTKIKVCIGITILYGYFK